MKGNVMLSSAARKIKKYNTTASTQVTKMNSEEREMHINRYAPLVKTIAGRLKIRLPAHISQDDLISAGIIGLLDAVDKFDPNKGIDFKSYAEFRIRGAMLDELRSMDWVPRSVRKNAKRLQEAYNKVEKENMRPATDEEVAKQLGVTLEEYYRLLDDARAILVINEDEINTMLPKGELDSSVMMNLSNTQKDPLSNLNLLEVKEVIAKAVEKLPKNESMVMALYYYEELTMKEIGKIMGYTESRVSQLHTKAVLRLRVSLKPYFNY
jgi:RNA polymerase sigma factor for flagellar operon FliA